MMVYQQNEANRQAGKAAMTAMGIQLLTMRTPAQPMPSAPQTIIVVPPAYPNTVLTGLK
jgi:hypothetical protein